MTQASNRATILESFIIKSFLKQKEVFVKFGRSSLRDKGKKGSGLNLQFKKKRESWKFTPWKTFEKMIAWFLFLLLRLTFVNLVFGLHLLFAQIAYFDRQGKIDAFSIEGWPEIKGHKIYPIYFLQGALIFTYFPWEEIIFWFAIALLPYLILPLSGRKFFSEIGKNE